MLYVTLLNTYTPPLLSKYGLSNGFVRKSEEIKDLCSHAEYCVVGREEFNNAVRFPDDVKQYLKENFNAEAIYGADESPVCTVYIRK